MKTTIELDRTQSRNAIAPLSVFFQTIGNFTELAKTYFVSSNVASLFNKRSNSRCAMFNYLKHGSWRYVQLFDAHDRLIQMMMHRNFEPLTGFQMKSIIESFCIQKHTQSIGFSDLRPFPYIPIVFAKNLLPIRNLVQLTIKGQLRLDDTANAIIRSKVGVEVGHIPIKMLATITCLQYHHPCNETDKTPQESRDYTVKICAAFLFLSLSYSCTCFMSQNVYFTTMQTFQLDLQFRTTKRRDALIWTFFFGVSAFENLLFKLLQSNHSKVCFVEKVTICNFSDFKMFLTIRFLNG